MPVAEPRAPVRAALPARGVAPFRTSGTTAASTGSSTREGGWTGSSGPPRVGRQAVGALGDGPLRRTRPAVLLERRRPSTSCSTGSSPPRRTAAWQSPVLGQRPGDAGADPARGFGDRPTIFDRLDERGIPWKFYVQDYDPRPRQRDRRSRCGCPCWARPAVVIRSASTIVGPRRVLPDLARRTAARRSPTSRPPARASIRRPGSGPGSTLVRRLVNALAMQQRLGQLRVPVDLRRVGRLVRPRAAAEGRRGHAGFPRAGPARQPLRAPGRVDSTQLDTTSILRFIEDNWRLAPLAQRDARANSLAGAFDFARGPRAPQPSRPPSAAPRARRPSSLGDLSRIRRGRSSWARS